MKSMFKHAYKFSHGLGQWDTAKSTNMDYTFDHAYAFNQKLVWDTSQVTSMVNTFYNAQAFTRSSRGIRG